MDFLVPQRSRLGIKKCTHLSIHNHVQRCLFMHNKITGERNYMWFAFKIHTCLFNCKASSSFRAQNIKYLFEHKNIIWTSEEGQEKNLIELLINKSSIWYSEKHIRHSPVLWLSIDLLSFPPNKSNKGQEVFGKRLLVHDQNIRNTKTPSQIPAQRSSSSHPIFALCLPSSAFLLSSESISQPVSVNHRCQNSSCTEVSTELFYAEKPPLNVSEICRSITGKETLPNSLPACYPTS